MAEKKYPRGSEWRRWDLHIHSPASLLNNQFEGSDENEKWSKYFDTLKALEGFAVLGITDYYSSDGYKRVVAEKANLPNIELFLANVETRIFLRTDSDRFINLHFIFSPKVAGSLDARFFPYLTFKYGERRYNCLRDSLIQLGRDFTNNQTLEEKAALKEGANQFKVSPTDIDELFIKDKELRDNCLIVVPNSSQDGNSGIQDKDFTAVRNRLYQLSDAIFSGNPSDRDYFLGKSSDPPDEVTRKYGSIKPCIHGSDAHTNSKVGKPDEDRFTWINADPTFDGLKQICHEPEARVRVEKDNPQIFYVKPYFSHFSLDRGKVFQNGTVEFSDCDIPLNPNMTCIIGGRGSGKSVLVQTLKNTYAPSAESEIVTPGFKVRYMKSDGNEIHHQIGQDNNLDYLIVSQGEVKSIVKNAVNLDLEIKRMLGIVEMDHSLSDGGTLKRAIDRILEIRQIANKTNEHGTKVNSISAFEADKKKNLRLPPLSGIPARFATNVIKWVARGYPSARVYR